MQNTREEYNNRNIQNNGDIIGLSNQSPMKQNQSFKPASKRIIGPIVQMVHQEKSSAQPTAPKPSIRVNMEGSLRKNDLFHEQSLPTSPVLGVHDPKKI